MKVAVQEKKWIKFIKKISNGIIDSEVMNKKILKIICSLS